MWSSRVFYYLALCHLVASQLQPVVQSDKENQYILQVLAFADRLFTIRSCIISLGECTSNICDLLPMQITDRFSFPVIMVGKKLNSLEGFVVRPTALLIFYSDFNDRFIQVMKKTLDAYHYSSFIFVHKSRKDLPLNRDERAELFEWSWRKRILKILLLETIEKEGFKVWAPNVTQKSRSISLLTDGEMQHLDEPHFLKHHKKLRFHILFSVYESFPIVYMYNTTRQGEVQLHLGGQDGIMMTEFVRYVQGSMELLCFSNRTDLERNVERIAGNRLVDIAVNTVINNSLIYYAPPAVQSRLCLVVPFARRLPLSKYFQHSVKGSLYWFWTFVIVANILVKRLSNPNVSWSELCYRNVNFFEREFRNMRPAAKVMELFTQLYMMIVISLICSAITTAITLGYYEPEIKDAQGLLASDIRIMINDHEQLRAFERNELPRELLPRVLLVDRAERQRHFLNLNVSFAYVVESLKWKHFVVVQQRLRKPKLILAPDQLCTNYRTFVYGIRPEAPFSYMFWRFVSISHETGLDKKWSQMGLQQAHQLGLINPAPYEPIEHFRLPFEFFQNAYLAYALGMLLSLVAFVLERMHVTWLRRREQQQAPELVYLE